MVMSRRCKQVRLFAWGEQHWEQKAHDTNFYVVSLFEFHNDNLHDSHTKIVCDRGLVTCW